MRDKEKFERDILDVLKKYGYNDHGIQSLYLEFGVNMFPEINIQYKYVGE